MKRKGRLTENQYSDLFLRNENNPIITYKDLPYRANSVFNAGVTKYNGETLLLLRVEDFRGHSHLTVAKSKDGVSNWRIEEKPTIVPDPLNFPEDEWGVEDARITYLEEIEKYAIAFVSYSHKGPLVSLALTEDFKSFERMGAVLPPNDKDAALFPKKINGEWVMLHRPYPGDVPDGAHVHISYSSDLVTWERRKIILKARDGNWWDASKIGLNTQPLLTEHGWLISYHGVRQTCAGCIYRLGLALLDTDNPEIVTHRSDEWVFGPNESYELQGDVGNVVFPCGWLKKNDEIWMYYGAADTSMALAIANYNDVIEEILKYPV